jgi:hypothetical protein
VAYDPKYSKQGQKKRRKEELNYEKYLIAETAHSGTERLLDNFKRIMSYRENDERGRSSIMYTTDFLPDH